MRIVALCSRHVGQLYQIYLEVTAQVAHCRFRPSLDQFGAGLAQPAQPETSIWVAEEKGNSLGFAASSVAQTSPDTRNEAVISALFTVDTLAGQALLDACINHAVTQNAHYIHAFPADHDLCPIPAYNAGWSGLSDRMAPVAQLLARRRFTPYHRELHLTCAKAHFPPRAKRSSTKCTLP